MTVVNEIKKKMKQLKCELCGKSSTRLIENIDGNKLVVKICEICMGKCWYRSDGRIEWQCEHSVGHTIYAPKHSDYVHGCCGITKKSCCTKFRGINNAKRSKNVTE